MGRLFSQALFSWTQAPFFPDTGWSQRNIQNAGSGSFCFVVPAALGDLFHSRGQACILSTSFAFFVSTRTVPLRCFKWYAETTTHFLSTHWRYHCVHLNSFRMYFSDTEEREFHFDCETSFVFSSGFAQRVEDSVKISHRYASAFSASLDFLLQLHKKYSSLKQKSLHLQSFLLCQLSVFASHFAFTNPSIKRENAA